MARGDEPRSATTRPRSATTSSTTASRCCARSSPSCDFPLLGANAVDPATSSRRSRRTSSRRSRSTAAPDRQGRHPRPDQPRHRDLGQGQRRGPDGVPGPGRAGQDLRAPAASARAATSSSSAAHSGADTSSSYGDALPYPENASTLVAEQVPGIDAILVGPRPRGHPAAVRRQQGDRRDGRALPSRSTGACGSRSSTSTLERHGGRLARRRRPRRDAELQHRRRGPEVVAAACAAPARHRGRLRQLRRRHLGRRRCRRHRAVVEDVPIIDFVNYVQADTVKAALAGTPTRACRCCRSPRRSTGPRHPGRRGHVRDVAGLYIYDNTLLGAKVTGAQVKDYLEFSASYFKPVTSTGPGADRRRHQRVDRRRRPTARPDYNYDSWPASTRR